MQGRVLDGRYRLISKLGEGGMGEVWRCYDERIGRDVAVKLLSDVRLTSDGLARFEREARVAGNLSGPSIVTVHDYGHSDQDGRAVPYLVMELLSGSTLTKVVEGDPDAAPVPVVEALGWIRQVCEALEIAHAAGVVHRDIKPTNVVLTSNGAVKVLDFGIARFAGDEQTRENLTDTGVIVGTAEYMSPEQAEGRKVDLRSDLYSLGCLIYFVLAGRPPFQADSFVGLAYQHVMKTPDAPSTHRLGIPPAVDELVLQLLAKAPADRPQSATAVRERLAAVVAELVASQKGPNAVPGAADGSEALLWAPGEDTQATRLSNYPGGTLPEPPARPTIPTGKPPGIPASPMPATPVMQAGSQGGHNPQGVYNPQQAPQGAYSPQGPGPQGGYNPQGQHGPQGQRPQDPLQKTPHEANGKASRRVFLGAAVAVVAGGSAAAGWALNRHSSPTSPVSGSSPTGSTSGTSGASTSTSAGPTSAATATGGPASSARPAVPASLPSLVGHSDGVSCVAFNPVDGRVIATGSFDSTCRLWSLSDLNKPGTVGTLSGHSDQIWGVAYTADGSTVVTASSDRTAMVWDVRSPAKPQRTSVLTGFADQALCVAINPGGVVAVGCRDGSVRVWTLPIADARTSAAVLEGHTELISSIGFSPDGKLLAVGSKDWTVQLWDMSDPARPVKAATLSDHTNEVVDLAFARQGRTLVASSVDKSAIMWNVADPNSPSRLCTVDGFTNLVTGVSITPDGHTLAVGGWDHALRLWNITDPANPVGPTVLSGLTGNFFGFAYSPDGRVLAGASSDKTVHLWRNA